MSFFIDQQTFNDLALFDKKGRESVFGIFNVTHTRGGGDILEQMFRYPLSGQDAINARSRTVRFFQDQNIGFPFKEEWFDTAEHYLQNDDERSQLVAGGGKLERMFNNVVGADADYREIVKGITVIIDILEASRLFIEKLMDGNDRPFMPEIDAMQELLNDEGLQEIMNDPARKNTAYEKKAAQDKLLRFKKKDSLLKLLSRIYQLDVYLTVAQVATERRFIFPVAKAANEHILKIEGVYHPLLEKAVDNDVSVTENSNIIFLTGANMAGKSTFMKSMGIAVFLAHLGFPVPAGSMEFSVMEGLFTTINLPDNIGMGYSHFYAEVRRVKKVTRQLAQSQKLFVIFDELFRGTNVKDAYDATVALTTAFARTHGCTFLISTHIIEAGEELKGVCRNIRFLYLPTRMQDNKPVYSYRLEKGITADRHGMVIINNEGIIDILRSSPEPKMVSSFVTDKQTLDDLNLQGKFKRDSVFSLFNQTKTSGGERLLESMFRQPLNDPLEINQRTRLFHFFQDKALAFPVENEILHATENYLLGGRVSNLFAAAIQGIRRKMLYAMGLKQEHELIDAGLKASVCLLQKLKLFVDRLLKDDPENPLSADLKEVQQIFNSKKLSGLIRTDTGKDFSFLQTLQYDYFLRSQLQGGMKTVMQLMYAIDVYIAVSRVSREKGFCYAQALPAGKNSLNIDEGFHPCLDKAVPNSVQLDAASNIIFLTGANMAGKSTFMKTFAICTYLAHMGFPVPARSMSFSVKDGIYTSINVSDNLDLGYSHFYAEVLRVKNIAQEVSSPKNLVVIFDELFKGTNVKDAYDATLAISEAFTGHENCFFIISTHIVEVGEALKKHSGHIHFTCMPTEMKGEMPVYTYRAKEGISSDRHGMMIIKNERILDFCQTV